MNNRSFRALMLAGAVALSLPACGNTDNAGLEQALRDLRTEVQDGRDDNKQLSQRLERIERRMDGYGKDIDNLSRTPIEAAALRAVDVPELSGDEAAALAASGGVPVASNDNLKGLLESEQGREAVESAMKSIQEKRDSERRERWVSSMIDRFAADANLTPDQSDKMQSIMGGSFKRMGEVWQNMRGGADQTPEQRAQVREDNLAKMEEIRLETDDEVKAVLNSEQMLLYEEQSARFRGFGGGRRGR